MMSNEQQDGIMKGLGLLLSEGMGWLDLHEGIEHHWFPPRYVTTLIGCFSTHSLFSIMTFLLVFGKKGLHLVDHWMLSSR